MYSWFVIVHRNPLDEKENKGYCNELMTVSLSKYFISSQVTYVIVVCICHIFFQDIGCYGRDVRLKAVICLDNFT